MKQTVKTFPSVRIPSQTGGLPVEVVLVAQMGVGAGNALIESAARRQQQHLSFVDALDEPSAKLGGVDFERGEVTSLYSFLVDKQGHPFHRHAGHRVFTAISGSGGAQLRFSTASSAALEADPAVFVDTMHFVNIPPDSLFTVRFGGGTWHQFVPLEANSRHPALFALSCHTNELGGELDARMRARVIENTADIPSLTETLPEKARALFQSSIDEGASHIPTISLSLHAPSDSLRGKACAWLRSAAGRLRRISGRWYGDAGGYMAGNLGRRQHIVMSEVPDSFLLQHALPGPFEHEDCVALTTMPKEMCVAGANDALARVLQGFLENRSAAVSRMMSLRNVLVRPLGLRTSPLGCPVSSLLCDAPTRFFGRYPVLLQTVSSDGRQAEVVLGADDKHLQFRTSVRAEINDDGGVTVWMATRVHTHNLFGRLYMAAIGKIHRHYIAPTMLRMAVEHAMCHDLKTPQSKSLSDGVLPRTMA